MPLTIPLKPQFLLSHILFALVLLAGLLLRLLALDRIPLSISYDELDHAANGAAFAETGRDLYDQHAFWELMPTETHTYTAEISAWWHRAVHPLQSSPLLKARLPNAIAGIVFVLAFSAFIWQLVGLKQVALLTFSLLWLNPWHIYVSRTGYEAPVALAWLMLSLLSFWNSMIRVHPLKKLALAMLSLLCLIAAFFSYHGYKIIMGLFFPILWVVSMWQQPRLRFYLKHRSNILVTIGLTTLWLFLLVLFVLRLQKGIYGDRQSEITLLDGGKIEQQVDALRSISLDAKLAHVQYNKASVVFDQGTQRLMEILDPSVLFTNGFDGSHVIGLWEHGFLYLFQFPLVLIGIYSIVKEQKKNFWLLLILLTVSLIPSIVQQKTSIALRSTFYLPILVFLSAYGANKVWQTYLRGRSVLGMIALAIVSLSVIRFALFYFVRFPIQTVDNGFFKEPLLATYLQRTEAQGLPITVHTQSPRGVLRAYLYFSGQLSGDTLRKAQQNFANTTELSTLQWRNMEFTTQCPTTINDRKIYVVQQELISACQFKALMATSSTAVTFRQGLIQSNESANATIPSNGFSEVLVLSSPRDNGGYYQIYHDPLCQSSAVPPYIAIRGWHLLDIQNLSNAEFCQNWTRREL